MSVKCSDCGESLNGKEMKCPRCGSGNKTIELIAVIPSPSLGLKTKSAEKDERGKPIKEKRIRVKGKTQTKITIDRSKRLKGIPVTDVFHEVMKNGKTVHGPHLEPKGKRKIVKP
jgi:predicted ATP-dependent serine protease